jgi:hypothetical protein
MANRTTERNSTKTKKSADEFTAGLPAKFKETMVKAQKEGEEEEPPHELFVSHRFQLRTYKMVLQARGIINEYAAQGHSLTLRQLFYQFVSRDLIANTHAKYISLGNAVKHARMNGMLSMESIVDRGRSLSRFPSYDGTDDALAKMVRRYSRDKWLDQETRLEVWVEKSALAAIVERACSEYEVPFTSTRGYASLTLLKDAYKRADDIHLYAEKTKRLRIVHFSDHDPSGVDMTRDIEKRLNEDFNAYVQVRRVALTMDQIDQYSPPPNFAKEKDTRYEDYVDEFGTESSWELDALEPQVLAELIEDEISEVIDLDQWNKSLEREADEREQLRKHAELFKAKK